MSDACIVQDDKSGEVSTEKLRSICKEFSLTLDIDKFIGTPVDLLQSTRIECSVQLSGRRYLTHKTTLLPSWYPPVSLTHTQFSDLINTEETDQDGSGTVDFEEFSKMMSMAR